MKKIDSQINFSTDRSTPPKLVPFESFEIKGGETVLKKVSFNLSDSIDNFRYAESAYKITLFASAMPETRGWLVGETLSFSITADDLTDFDMSRMKKLPNGTWDVLIASRSKPTSELDKNIGMLTALLKGHGSINAFQLNSRAIKFLYGALKTQVQHLRKIMLHGKNLHAVKY